MRALKPAESRVAAIALLIVTLVLAYFILLHWWFVAPLSAINDQMDDLRDTQSRYAAAIAEKPLLQKRLATLGQDQVDSSTFLPERDANAAAASLMQRVVDDAATHAQEGTCEISQKMPVSNPGESPGDVYRKVAVNIGLHCDIQPLVELLYTLEKGKPYLFIQDFSVYRNPIANTQRVQSVPLEVQFTLAGYIHAAAASTDAGQAQSGGGR